MNQLHSGIELDLKYKPIDMLQFGITTSFADWHNTNDVKGEYDPDVNGPEPATTINFYVKDLKIGDAPQNQFVFSASLRPVEGLDITALYSYYSNFYADWDPFSRQDANDRAQSWKLPSYGLLNFHINYRMSLSEKFGVTVFAHVFNALDEIYISDAVDNSKYNSYKVDGSIVNPHKADAAEIFLGTPRKFNLGLKLDF